MSIRSIIIIVLAGLLAACSRPGLIREDSRFDHTRTYSVEYARVWNDLQKICQNLPLEQISTNAKTGIIILRGNTYTTSWADEGQRGRFLFTRDRVVARDTNMRIQVSTQGAYLTRVKIVTQFNMQIRHGNGWLHPYSYRWQHAPSTGTAEDCILDELSLRLQLEKPRPLF